MAGKKTITPSIFIVMAVCLLISSMAFAEETRQQNEETYAPGFYYTVQKGDTLWSLSKKFYDSEWEWPAMWEQNEQLTNPHELYPGQRIRLLQRTEPIAAPESGQPEDGAMSGDTTVAEAGSDVDTGSGAGAGMPMIEPVYFIYPGIDFIDFIKKLPPPKGMLHKTLEDPLTTGTILKSVGSEKSMISQNDLVYIEPLTGDYVVGDLYSVYRPLLKINDEDTGAYVGHQYRIIATAEITSVEQKYVMAKITKAHDTIQAGFSVMPQEKRKPEIPLRPAPEGLQGKILGAEDHIEMFSDYTIIFLNKGENDGVEIGQRYDVYHQDKYNKDTQEVMLSRSVFGKLLVLNTQATTCTAIVTKSTHPIRRGDLFKSTL